MRRKRFKDGFTLIELSLSMVFVGILSVAVVLIINDTVAAYRRGLTLNEVTTTGMDVVDDMRTAVQNSSSKSVVDYCYIYYNESSQNRNDCVSDGAYNFIAWKKTASVDINMDGDRDDRGENDVPVYGAFCTGTYSYIWNTGYYYLGDNGEIGAYVSGTDSINWAKLTYKMSNSDGGDSCSLGEPNYENGTCTVGVDKPFRLLKVNDPYRGVCTSVVRPSNGGGYDTNAYEYSEKDLSGAFSMVGYGAVSESPVDLILVDKDNDLALFDLTVARPAESSTRKNTFYSTSFILGTIRGGVNIMASGKSCETPENYDTGYFEYCAINRFNFAVQAGNRG